MICFSDKRKKYPFPEREVDAIIHIETLLFYPKTIESHELNEAGDHTPKICTYRTIKQQSRENLLHCSSLAD